MPGLDGGHGLPGDARHSRELLLGQAAGLPGQPQPRPVRVGDFRHAPACLVPGFRHTPTSVMPRPSCLACS